MGIESTLIPTRFLTTVGHLIALLMIFYTKDANVRAGIRVEFSTAEYDDAQSSLDAALWMSVICFAIELLGIFGGFSLFMPALCTFDIGAHFCGAVFCCWFILESWHYESMWYIFLCFSLLPALAEGWAFARVCLCKIAQY
jgi:hypothetical protein